MALYDERPGLKPFDEGSTFVPPFRPLPVVFPRVFPSHLSAYGALARFAFARRLQRRLQEANGSLGPEAGIPYLLGIPRADDGTRTHDLLHGKQTL